jgi:protein-S-isoprenylcysteine O-methyltransferase Ste14
MKRLAFASYFPPLAPALRSLSGGVRPAVARVPRSSAGTEAEAPRAATRDLADLAAKILIVTLFGSMAMRLARDAAATGHVTGMLLVASEALVVVLTMVRRPAGLVDRTLQARLLTGFSTFGPPLVRPMSGAAIAPEALTVAIAAIGLMIVVLGKLSLGRSFGLSPANRGVVSTGMYRFMRHPIYLGYLITHVGFVAAHPAGWNLIVLAAADLALMFRAVREEQTLAQDEAYREYMQRVRWRVIPGVF